MRLSRRPLSLALRLTLLFSIAAAIVFPVFGLVISQSMEHHFVSQDSDELKVIVSAVRDVLTSAPSEDVLSQLKQRFDDILVGHHDASLFLSANNGKLLYASPSPNLSSVDITTGKQDGQTTIRWWDAAGSPYTVTTRLISHAGPRDLRPLAIVAAVPFAEHQQFLVTFRRNLWLMIAGSIIVMGLMGWIAVRQGHAPLHDIVAWIRRISANELNTRLPPEGVPHELVDLVVSFNEMLQRVDAAFHRLADFNADIAHELRTPVTNLMTQTQVALSRARNIDEYREILYSNMEEYERMAQMVGDMLFLAQTDNRPQIKNFEELDLAVEVQALFDYYEGWAEERGVTLALEGAAMVTGDRSMLRRAFGNLLSNAIRHTPAGGTVRVKLDTSNANNTGIIVENPGPEIPPEHLAKLFDRFYRVDASRQRGGDGAGLGLAIVKAIVTAHGGQVGVVSTAGMTRFQISLPGPPASIVKTTVDTRICTADEASN